LQPHELDAADVGLRRHHRYSGGMPRYAAFLRGVMPMNSNMAELRRRFEKAGYADVRTVLGSGNVVFTARRAPREGDVSKAAGFTAFVRSIDDLQALAARDPFAKHRLDSAAKRVVTFLRARSSAVLPEEVEGARILGVDGTEVFTAYVPGATSPVFMTLIEKTFGKEVTTRTWDTIQKVIRAGSEAAPAPKETTSRRAAAVKAAASRRRTKAGRRRG
jgi:uncharacterized protein (DUF1697 family)